MTRDRLSERDAALRIIGALRDAGRTAYLAGGCVRDELLGVEPKDYDVATDAHPDQIQGLFSRTASVGAAFGVILVHDFGPTVEVATFRADGPYSDARRPDSVTFSTPEMDAQRRDFTVNALFIDPFGDGDGIIDFVDGRRDVESRTLRAVGDPDARLREDHLRALRGVRFAAKYGLTVDDATARAIREHASALSGVSVERVGEEIRRMMAHPSRAAAAWLVHGLGLEDAVFGESLGDHALRTINALDGRADAMTALAAWAHDRLGGHALDASHAKESGWHTALNLSNEDAVAFARTLGFVGSVINDWGSMGVAARKRLASSKYAQEGAYLLAAVSPGAHERYTADVAALENDGIGIAPTPLIGGDDLIDAGFTPGPAFGGITSGVYDAQLAGTVNSKEEALDLAREIAKNEGAVPDTNEDDPAPRKN